MGYYYPLMLNLSINTFNRLLAVFMRGMTMNTMVRQNAKIAKTRDLPVFTPALARELEPLYRRVAKVIPEFEWPVYAQLY